MEATTPAESARTEDPGLSIAREAAEVLPAESVRRNGNQQFSLKPRLATPESVRRNGNQPVLLNRKKAVPRITKSES